MSSPCRFRFSLTSHAAAIVACVALPGQVSGAVVATEFTQSIVSAAVNDQPVAESVVVFADGAGKLYIRVADATAWRLNLQGVDSVVVDDERIVALDDLPLVKYVILETQQRLEVKAPPSAFIPSSLDLSLLDLPPMTPPGTGAFLNYDLFGERNSGDMQGGALFEAGLFSSLGYGSGRFAINYEGRRLRPVRLETNWTRENPDNLHFFRIGDAISRGSAAARPFRLAGLQWGSDFSIRPGLITFPVSSLNGSAAVPSVADVYVNDVLAGSHAVPAGPFEVTNIPVVSGDGRISLVVRDALGRQSEVTVDYYASTELLRKGLQDFSYEVGFLRKSFALRSADYASPVFSATHRRGVSSRLTAEAHAEASPHAQLASMGMSYLLGKSLIVGGVGGASRGPKGIGHLIGFNLERQQRALTFSVDAQFASSRYKSVADYGAAAYPSTSIRAIVSAPVGRMRLGGNVLIRHWTDRPRQHFAGMTATLPFIGGSSLSMTALYAGKGKSPLLGFNLSTPLGRRNSSIAYRYEEGRSYQVASLQQDLPPGTGYGYQVRAARGAVERLEARGFYQNDRQAFEVGIARAAGANAVRGSVRGAIGMIDGRPLVARELADSFAIVQTDGFKGVRVYADNALVARTGKDGTAVVPLLRAFDRNVIRIEQGDLPLGVSAGSYEQSVRPYRRTGSRLVFDAARRQAVLITAVLPNGNPVPSDAIAKLDDGKESIGGPDGQFFFEDVGNSQSVRLEWKGGACRIPLAIPADADLVADLGVQGCK
ncbi:fimbrial biogenesis outer membrane usher protein [Sphingomonas sinipercae]|uniref:Fimbrial biogenesis outer membrane usher protein n=1 Tax=Sphingomonas sinipercae TaxID=2714944 RepID=A0A6G7ZQD3_9SPHN|nr:fimbria/pilus outer membrane usher protein [Sphingomonas sinipercae]QIL03194.1 fimbrial biogenesis outer membrane usher protein [Sphingomonas sinipercae]